MKFFAIAFLSLVITPALLHSQAHPDRSAENPKAPHNYTREHQLIFFAVLEGLYEDGVAGEALELILPDPLSMFVEGHPEKTNFVYSCPLCMPAFNAFQLYAARSPFYGQKGTRYNTFGEGVSDEMRARLKGAPKERRQAIQDLIRRWVKRRLDALTLTEEARTSIEENLKEMKDKGEATLKRFKDGSSSDYFAKNYDGWEKCPICSGASWMGE